MKAPMPFEFLPLIAILATLFVCLGAEPLGIYFGVLAHPDGRRKTHARPTPQLGGFAILLGFVLWLGASLLVPQMSGEPLVLSVLLCALGLGLVGFIDDKHEVPPILRILLLLLFVGIAFALDPQLVASALHWYSFGTVPISAWVYAPLMGLTAIGLVNSVNMADGQNGLVGSMFVTWTACLAFVCTGPLSLMAGMLCALCVLFLAFNLGGKLFLGDCGSYGITFVIGLMVTLAHARGQVPLETVIVWFFIPVIDCIRLMIARPLQGKSLFQGGRDHFHHRLIDSMGPRLSAFVYISAVTSSSALATLAPRFSLVILCVLSGFYFGFAHLSGEAVSREIEPAPEEALNVVPLKSGQARRG